MRLLLSTNLGAFIAALFTRFTFPVFSRLPLITRRHDTLTLGLPMLLLALLILQAFDSLLKLLRTSLVFLWRPVRVHIPIYYYALWLPFGFMRALRFTALCD
jgi:hypothetical protein